MKSHHVLVLLAAAAALVGGLLVSTRLHEPATQAIPHEPVANGETVLASVFPDLNGQHQALAQWRGKVLVVNFWATWCPPCREEIPGFIALQRELGDKSVQFVGIAIDKADKVNDFARELGINYPLLLGGDSALELQRQLGNPAGVLPFTLIIDATGKLAAHHVGALNGEQLKRMLTPLLGQP
jgi:thiol-disulfide isomerase/thioredoxin